MDIKQVDEGIKGYFKGIEGDQEAGRMVYTWAGQDKLIIDHTEVNPNFKGKGIGKQLLMAVVEFARNNKVKILPLCPFAKSVFDKSEEIRDVLF